MNTEKIIEKLSYYHKSDLETLFNAILNAKLPSHEYSLGQAKQLNDFKKLIIMSNGQKFQMLDEVSVDIAYRNDECTANIPTTETALVMQQPMDIEELICIQYTNGTLDYVPQNILTKL